MTARPRSAPVGAPPPPGLSEASLRLWPGLVSDLAAATGADGAVAELDLIRLGDLLRVRDRLDAIGAQIAEDGVVVDGSTGQRQRNPLLDVEARLRTEWVDGLARLGLWSGAAGTSIDKNGRLRRESS